MGKIKALNFFTLPEKIKQHNIDVFIKKSLSQLVENSYSWFESRETLFRKLTDNYLGKYCFDDKKQIIEITLPLLEQEVRRLENDQSINCPIQVKTPTHNRKKRPESDLFIAASLKNLVRHAVRYSSSNDELFATLIYNYLGKWCHDEQGELIQVNIARLEALARYFLKDENVRCQLDVDAILLARVNDLISEENACTKAIKFDGSKKITDENLVFFLQQMNDPENIRKKSLLGANNRHYAWKYNYQDEKYHPKKQDPNRGKRVKQGTLHTTKTSTSIVPTKPGHMQNFDGGIILLFAFSEVHHSNKYIFTDNAGTNDEYHYAADDTIPPWNTGYFVPVKRIHKQNRAAVKANEIIPWNEVKAGLPKRGIRAIIANRDTTQARLHALESMYIIKKTFNLDYDLPLARYQLYGSLQPYTHELRIQDAISLQWHTKKDKKELFQQIVNSSWSKLQSSETKQELQELYGIVGLTLPKTEHFTQRRYKRYNHTLDIANNRLHITEILPSAPAALISPPGEKILSVAGMLSFFPMVGYGCYKWIKDSFDEDMETGWEDLGQIVGVILATLTMLPVFFYGCYYAIQNILAPSRRHEIASPKIPQLQ